MEASLSKRPPVAVTNLIPKIKNLIAEGDKAGARYYKAAGVELNKAKAKWDGDDFMEWAVETFNRDQRQLYRWMQVGRMVPAALVERTLSQAVGDSRHHHTPGWQAPVQEVIDRLNVRAMAQERQDREKEEKLQRTLGNQLIDIGYKVLAAKLHPDKPGGSDEAMQRLNEVKRILKGAL